MVALVSIRPPASRRLDVHVELLVVFLGVWLVLGAYSFLEEPVSLGGIALTQTDVRERLSPAEVPTDVELPPATGASDPSPAQAAAASPSAAGPSSAARSGPPPPPLDPSPQRIMIVGDSMVVNLIQPLADYCQENGHKLFPVIWYASTTVAWGSQSKLSDCLREFDPTYVIVVLGASELGVRDVASRQSSVRTINKIIGNRHYFWLGPPNWREDTGFNDMVHKTVGAGRFFRSAGLELDRESDGIHPTPTAGRKWVDAFARWMETEAAVRIPMKPPTRPAQKPPAKVYPPPYRVPEGYLEKHRK